MNKFVNSIQYRTNWCEGLPIKIEVLVVVQHSLSQPKEIVLQRVLKLDLPGVWRALTENVAYVTTGNSLKLSTTHPGLKEKRSRKK